ncbi:MAG: UDP-2,3-diacylglucosamine diphosphatase LpxI [Caldimicrobium sp.]|nr:UDP-2,3-diacylglucosamine diphosphatase LpxI [Caldimicrobium sp.]MCX7613471.1 UDP-2,3-diacylglucosamine diphosphatase LpxI [Caldimicrobium sp.]MDW8182957.1 UDP-2,3-diacylglucosamine diphosphatase LpxI [Caldimicrobium sp.]
MDEGSSKIGLVAGEGAFPLILAEELKTQGFSLIALTFSRNQAKNLESYAKKVYQIYIGQLEKLIEIFKKEGVVNLIFLGKIEKSLALRFNFPDKRALNLWKRLSNREDNTLLKALAADLEGEGFRIRGPAEFLKKYLVEEMVYTKVEPTPSEWEDIRYGMRIGKAIGELDIGQCVVVKDKMTVAVEALEGTDATILRGGKLRSQAVVVKTAKPNQDIRLDLPVVGLQTIEIMIKAKAKVLALEAERTFFLQRSQAIELADKYQITIVGVK